MRINIIYCTFIGISMQIVHVIDESSAQSNKLFNAAHVFSSINRKMMPPVDKQGNAQVFGLRFQVYSDAANTVTLKTASNSYVTKQAVKAWYRAWRKSHSEAGYSLKDLGKYGKWFKPQLTDSDSTLGSGAEDGRGEWNTSDMVVTPPATASGGLAGNEVSDQYSLHLIGTTTVESSADTRRFSSVGMINSWLGSRRSTTGTDGDTVAASKLFDADNPLILARGNSLHSETLSDEVIDLQADLPPYDNQDFDALCTQGVVKTNADLSAAADIMAPCGLVNVTTTAACIMVISLIGITDM